MWKVHVFPQETFDVDFIDWEKFAKIVLFLLSGGGENEIIRKTK